MISLVQLRDLLRQNPDIDVCVNRRGVKIGGNNTDQTGWFRAGWHQLTLANVLEGIKQASSYTKESPSLVMDSEPRATAAQATGVAPPRSRDDVRRRLEQWRSEKAKSQNELLDIEAKYCHGTECDSYVEKFCRQENLSQREADDLKKFISFAKREGYLSPSATAADVKGFCQTWKRS